MFKFYLLQRKNKYSLIVRRIKLEVTARLAKRNLCDDLFSIMKKKREKKRLNGAKPDIRYGSQDSGVARLLQQEGRIRLDYLMRNE